MITGDTVHISWDGVASPSGYDVVIFDDTGHIITQQQGTDQTELSFRASILNSERVYTVSVGAKSDDGSDTAEIWNNASFRYQPDDLQ